MQIVTEACICYLPNSCLFINHEMHQSDLITLVCEACDASDVPAEHGPALVQLVRLEASVPPVPSCRVGRGRARPLLFIEVSETTVDIELMSRNLALNPHAT